MNITDVMQSLQAAGTAQNRAIYARRGVLQDQFGVSLGELRKLAKTIRKDQPLAEQLWQTNNHDARILAAMIADPKMASGETLEYWVNSLDNYLQADAFAGFAAETPFLLEKIELWTVSTLEWVSRTGWLMLAHAAMKCMDLEDVYFLKKLEIIEKNIHTSPNYTRDAMNSTLIAIGIRNPTLQTQALAAAGRIGFIQVDHGQTGCVTPDATGYIQRTWNRKTA